MSGYSLPETVAAFHSFYTFLTTLPSDITPQTILTPPGAGESGGWPSLTPTFLSPLRKTLTVITSLRQLPYIAENPGTAGTTQIAPYTSHRLPGSRHGLELGQAWTNRKDNGACGRRLHS